MAAQKTDRQSHHILLCSFLNSVNELEMEESCGGRIESKGRGGENGRREGRGKRVDIPCQQIDIASSSQVWESEVQSCPTRS